MAFDQRSYGGKLFRPSPIIHYEEGQNLIIAATPWGEAHNADEVIQLMVDYFMSALDDFEATAPFEKLSCLSMTANHLRIACLIANDKIYRDINRAEYLSGMEIFASAHIDNEFVFVHLGLPHILLNRKTRGLFPISTALDLSFDISGPEILPPLPNQLLGLDPTCHLTVNSFRPQEDDQLVLVSRSSLPSNLFAENKDKMTLTDISRILAKDNVDMPFWLGLYSF